MMAKPIRSGPGALVAEELKIAALISELHKVGQSNWRIVPLLYLPASLLAERVDLWGKLAVAAAPAVAAVAGEGDGNSVVRNAVHFSSKMAA